ncbi:MAG: TrkA family potassium uptake protein [Chloroflexi bacterium]|nr:TrkA family potassium uptake protein [Chloroflexota bacterium]
MYIIIVGGGKVGRGAARDLIDMGHEVCVVERDANTAWSINNELGEVALLGDGAEIHVQRAAGMNRADVVVACTGRDQANLAVGQTAQTRFNVDKVISRINDPRNERIFRALGFTFTISATTAIVSAIEQEVSAGLTRLTQLRSTAFILAELAIPHLAPAVGCTVRELSLPSHTVLALVIREDDQPEVPGPNTIINAADVIVAVTQPQHEAELRMILTGES